MPILLSFKKRRTINKVEMAKVILARKWLGRKPTRGGMKEVLQITLEVLSDYARENPRGAWDLIRGK